MEPDGAPALLNDAVADGKPQTGALADFLGGEEGLEYFIGQDRRDPLPGVAHFADDLLPVIPGLERDGLAAGRSVLAFALFLDGVPRVEQQVDEHLLQAAGIGQDPGDVRLEVP